MQIIVDLELVGDEGTVFRFTHDRGGDNTNIFAAVAFERGSEFREDRGELTQTFEADPALIENLVTEENGVFKGVQCFD